MEAWALLEWRRSLSGLADSTLAVYSRDAAAAVVWMTEVGVAEPAAATGSVLRGYVRHLVGESCAPRTVARKLSVLRRYFKWALRTGRVTADPTTGIQGPRFSTRLPEVLKTYELDALLAAPVSSTPDDEARDYRDLAVIEVLYGSGLRVSELCGLKLTDVDLDTAVVRIWGKGSKQRLAPLSESAVLAIERWMATARGEFRHAAHTGGCAVPQPAGMCAQPPRCSPHPRPAQRFTHAPARTATHFRDSSPRRRSRSAGSAEAAGALRLVQHPDIHACES